MLKLGTTAFAQTIASATAAAAPAVAGAACGPTGRIKPAGALG